MKKLILIALFAMFAFIASAQSFNKQNLLLYADTNNLVGGEVLVRHVYGYLPTLNSQDGTVTFDYARVYYLDGKLWLFREEKKEGAFDEEFTMGGTTYTFKQAYDLIIDINQTNWNDGSWQVFTQFIIN